MIEKLGTVPYSPRRREAFQEGALAEQWFEDYPELFDELDRANIRSQREHGHHFAESLAAITLHVATGYSVLFHKYEFDGHERKNRIFRRIVGDELADLVRDANAQGPDLFLYGPEETHWLFCEVKRDRDQLSDRQRRLFESISGVSDQPVYLMRLKEWTAT